MARWEPDARGRLEKAAMDLFQERGYVPTTVEDIASRAGLAERTFFRYFADKREVLFSGAKELEKSIVDSVARAPRDASALGAVLAAFETAGTELEERRDLQYVRARYALVAKHGEILERELMKMASLTGAVTRALHARGVPEPLASVAAHAGITAFRIGFERWVNEREPQPVARHIRAAAEALRAVVTEETSKTGTTKVPVKKNKKDKTRRG